MFSHATSSSVRAVGALAGKSGSVDATFALVHASGLA
jgi:hypothetical protein